jgi:hypothetical protein
MNSLKTIIFESLESHNVNDERDHVEGVKNVVIDEFLDLIDGKRYYISEGGDVKLALDGDAIDDVLQEKDEYLSSSDQMHNHVEKIITEMGLDTMASKNVFLP